MSIYAGAKDPEKLQIPIRGPAGVDLSTVVSVSATVEKPKGQRATWTFGIDPNPSASRIVLVRVFAENGRDVPDPGNLKLGLFLTFPGDVVRRCKPIHVPILEWP